MAASEEPLQQALAAMFARPIHETYAHKDVPRLVKRITLMDSTGPVHDPSAIPEGEALIDSIVGMINLLAQRLEPARAEEIAVRVQAVRDSFGGGDMQLVMHDLWDAIGVESPVCRALSVIHQGVVLEGAFRLQRVKGSLMTKDIRSGEGWRINITLADFVQITHMRREQSLDQFGDMTSHFEMEWEIRMTFSADMSALTASSLRITGLSFGDEVAPARRDELRRTLVGDLIVE